MDRVKEAFGKIKEEMNEFRRELSVLYSELGSIRSELTKLNQSVSTDNPTDVPSSPVAYGSQTDASTDIPTHKPPVKALYSQYTPFSSGNEGVPTDRQTHEQIAISTDNLDNQTQVPVISGDLNTPQRQFEYANKIMDSLDEVKKQIRRKFKQLTPQEWAVFSLLYSLEEQGFGEITYKTIANNLKLSESSIRDYVNRLLIKGVPIEKTRLNNKTILLSISNNLKKVVTLSTLMRLREL